MDNKNIRYVLRKRLSELRKEIKDVHGDCLTLYELDELSRNVRNSYKNSLKDRHYILHEQASLASLHILSCFSLAKAIFDECEDENNGYLFPEDWVEGVKTVNPNRILSNLILALVKTAASIVYLSESGFDNQARSLGRSLAELSWQILILTFYKEKLSLYISPDNEKDANEAWFKLFGKGKTSNDLKQIEACLNFPEVVLKETKELRESIFHFFSMSLHNSFISVVVNNYSLSFYDDTAVGCDFAGNL